MSKDNLNIEELFQESFKGYKLNPSFSVWNKINKSLQVNQFFKFNFSQVNVYYAVVSVAIFVGVVFYSTNNIAENTAQKISKSDNIVLTTKKVNHKKSNTNKAFNLTIKEDAKENIIKSENQILEKKTEKISKIAPLNILNSLKALSIIYGDSLKKLDLITYKQPHANFSIVSKFGCVPFNLNLNNCTENAYEYEWNFGDGGKSKSKNPDYTYRYAGVYKISLTVKGFGGTAYSIIDSIQVHDNPTAKVFWPYSMPLFTNQKIIIPNETENAIKYEWSFGDKTISKAKAGIHSYQEAGNYVITLKTWSKNSCYDSTIVSTVKVINANSKIVFPTAFTPSTAGPLSGYYNNNDYHNDIFHPITNTATPKYNLKIFSKAGVLVFETNDINIGWDGYYHNRKLPEGVYPYIASGEFENKQKFLKKGDVTIVNK